MHISESLRLFRLRPGPGSGGGASGRSIAITPDGDFAYVTNVGIDNVSVIDLTTNTVTATVRVGAEPKGIAITPDGTFAYVANERSPYPLTVSVIDLATNTVTGTVPLPLGASFDLAIRLAR